MFVYICISIHNESELKCEKIHLNQKEEEYI
jgi:hypothetical protein